MGIDSLLTRRSIRKYKDKPVPQDLVDMIIRAGTSAPSAGDEQPWHFIVMDDRNILMKITEFHPHAAMLKESPLAVLVCCDLKLEKHTG